MENEKVPNIVIQSPPTYQEKEKSSWKQSNNVRLLIIAVAVFLVSAVIVTGFILGFRFHTSSTESALTPDNKKTETLQTTDGEETIETDDDGLTKMYTVKSEYGSYQVLYDYNKNIRVMKRDDHCIVTPMNSSDGDPEKKFNSDGGSGSMFFKRDTVPVRDTSFLGDKGQEMCQHMLVYWAFPTCPGEIETREQPDNTTAMETPNRQKRHGTHQWTYHHYCCAPTGYVCCLQSPCTGLSYCSSCVERYLLVYYHSSVGYHYEQCIFVV